MNYITEINKFYDWLETNPVSDSSIVLWHALMHINNKCGWKNEFAVAISTLELKTGLSKSSILRSRNNLTQSGRINFKTRNGQQSAVYSIIAFHGGAQSEAQSGTQTITQSGAQTVTQTVPITKLNKTKQNETLSSPDEPEEKKKVSFQHWDALVKAWFDFYKEKFHQQPSFNGPMAANYKSICIRIKKLSEEKQFQWTEQHATKAVTHFFNKAWADDWLKANFLLTNMSTKFDSIVNSKLNGTTKNGKQPTGSAVNTISILSKIDAMSD